MQALLLEQIVGDKKFGAIEMQCQAQAIFLIDITFKRRLGSGKRSPIGKVFENGRVEKTLRIRAIRRNTKDVMPFKITGIQIGVRRIKTSPANSGGAMQAAGGVSIGYRLDNASHFSPEFGRNARGVGLHRLRVVQVIGGGKCGRPVVQ